MRQDIADPFALCDIPLATNTLTCSQGWCDDECDDPTCIHDCHLPDRDTIWGSDFEDEEAGS